MQESDHSGMMLLPIYLSYLYFSLSLHLQPRNPCKSAITMRATGEFETRQLRVRFWVPARSDDSSIMSYSQSPTIISYPIHLPDATCFAKTRLFLLHTQMLCLIVPDCACTYSVRMVPSQGDSGYARQYLFLEKALIEFMFLIGTRPAP